MVIVCRSPAVYSGVRKCTQIVSCGQLKGCDKERLVSVVQFSSGHSRLVVLDVRDDQKKIALVSRMFCVTVGTMLHKTFRCVAVCLQTSLSRVARA